MIRLDAVVSAVAAEAGLDPDRVTQDKTNIVRWVNDTRREIAENQIDFQALQTFGQFVGVANVTAGTCAATQNQAEVTGSSTSWTTAMSGRYIAINSTPWQRVSYVTDSTHLTLEASWNQSSITGKTYILWKREYEFPASIDKIERVRDMSQTDALSYYPPDEFSAKFGFGDFFSDPYAYTQFGTDVLGLNYLGSTVYASITTTANSPIVDFASTAGLVTGLFAGDRLMIGNATTSTAFVVQRVLTDSKVALRDYVNVTLAAQSATAMTNDRLLVRFYNAIDNTRIYNWEGKKRIVDLIGNGDLIEEGWYSAIRKGAIAKCMGYINSPKEQQKLAEYTEEVRKLIRDQAKTKNPYPRLKPNIQRRYGQFGMYPSKRDLG